MQNIDKQGNASYEKLTRHKVAGGDMEQRRLLNEMEDFRVVCLRV